MGANEALRLALGCAVVVLVCGFAPPRASESAAGPGAGSERFPEVTALAPRSAARTAAGLVGGEGVPALAAASFGETVPTGAPPVRTGPLPPSRVHPRRAFVADGDALERPTSSALLRSPSVLGALDARRWRAGAPPKTPVHGRRLHGIGYPAVGARGAGRSARTFGLAGARDDARARPPIGTGGGERVYRPLVTWQEIDGAPGARRPIPRLRCMGLKPAAVARRAARYESRIVQLSMRHGVSSALVKAVITQESCFDPHAESPVGAFGLMQLMPATAKWLDVRDRHSVNENLGAGIRYLAMLDERFGGDTELVLAAYNAGPGNVRRYDGVPPFAETRHYVKRVQAHYRRYVAATALAAR